MTHTLADVDVDIESAFNELQCDSHQSSPHGGDVFAWAAQHDCYSGFLCHGHYKNWVERILPRNIRMAELDKGRVKCPICSKKYLLEDYVKVVVL